MTPKDYYLNVVCKKVKKHFGHAHVSVTDSILSSAFNPEIERQGDCEIKYGYPILMETESEILRICEEIRAHYAIEENLDIDPYEN